MLRCPAAAAHPTRYTWSCLKFTAYNSPAGTSALSAGHKHRVMRQVALALLRVSGWRNIYSHATVQDELCVVSTAAATRMSLPAKGLFPGEWWIHKAIVGTYLLVYSPYYPPLDGWVAWIKERCVDNAVCLDGQRHCRCAWQPEVQSKVDVLSAPPATLAEAAVQRNIG